MLSAFSEWFTGKVWSFTHTILFIYKIRMRKQKREMWGRIEKINKYFFFWKKEEQNRIEKIQTETSGLLGEEMTTGCPLSDVSLMVMWRGMSPGNSHIYMKSHVKYKRNQKWFQCFQKQKIKSFTLLFSNEIVHKTNVKSSLWRQWHPSQSVHFRYGGVEAKSFFSLQN